MYSIENISFILQANAIIYSPNRSINYLVTDSRRIIFASSSLFFALKTQRRNGGDFIKEIYEIGVRNFVVDKNFAATEFIDANFLFVDDTLKALQQLAVHHRSQFNYPVIGITGSNGKTIVKEWLYQLLSPQFNIVRSPRSYNSQIGVPLSVWQMNNENNLGIFEAGISTVNEMDALQKIIQPTIGIFTNIGEAHNEGFKNSLQKVKEKFNLFKESHILFCNADDEIIKNAISDNHSYKIFSFGFSEKSALKIISIKKQRHETKISAQYYHQRINSIIPFTDDASIQNAIICLCILLYFEMDEPTIVQRMKGLLAVDMRMQLIQAVNDCSLINDSYSFDINSFNIALDFLLQQQQHSKKTVIISDLPSSQNYQGYENAASILKAKKIHRVIAIGSNWFQQKKLLTGNIFSVEFFQSTEDFIHQLNTNHFKNEAILLKGARVFKFEKIVSLLEKKVHQTVMEISLTALAHNLKQYQQQLKPGTKLMAMVKAFGYGSGSAEVASVLQFHKVDYLAVAYADEGVELRKAGIRLPILVLNIDEAAFETLVQYNLEPELFSIHIFKSFITFIEKQALQGFPVHIKIDSGMHRLGFEETDIAELKNLLQNNSTVVIKSVFSHFAASEDENEDAFTQEQVNILERCCAQIQSTLKYSFLKHIANSAAIFRFPQFQFDMVRLGIGLYGIDSTNEQHLSLQNVCSLKTTIAQLKKLKAGETVGYNRKKKLLRNSIIATIRIGYADGFKRILSNEIGKVFIKGSFAPVIGNISMDMTMIDTTNIPDIFEGDEVEIFGKNISVQQIANWCKTIPYEILTGINQRVKRIYTEE
ncbi:MAG: bifunctional UDP-N-acetylmuramoyl-tripeptide:D-alanyl-D-alanine ligase/alanine racemase [Chitinophagaceae bacterium]